MSSNPGRLVELSTIISKNTAILDKHLQDNDIPQPSFQTLERIWDKDFPPPIQAARVAIQDASTQICELLMGPTRFLQKVNATGGTSLDTIHRLDVPHKIPLDDPNGIAYSELFDKIEEPVNEYALIRILRSTIAHRIFSEPSPGRIAHSAVSRLLATDDGVFDWSGSSPEVIIPRQFLGKAMEKFPAMDEPDGTAASMAYSAAGEGYISFYQYINNDPERSRLFGSAMSQFQKSERFATRHTVDGFDWGSLGEGSVVVDVGGSHGAVALAIARKFPKLKIVVQDLPDTIASASAAKKMVETENLDIEFLAHDFFTPQPTTGAKIYMLRWILHNWPDKYCVKILRNLMPAMAKDSRVLIVDAVMPELGTLPNFVERDLRTMDLSMLSCFNAGDREIERYERILEESGLGFGGWWTPEGSRLSLMVGVKK